MKRSSFMIFIEKWLIKLIIIQFICLIIGQVLVQHHNLAPYVNKTIKEEGVVKNTTQTATETMEQVRSIWYHNK